MLQQLKEKKNVKIAVIAVILIAVVLALIISNMVRGGSKTTTIDISDTTVLQYSDMQDSISATGIVESAHSTKVYSTLTSSVKQVNVAVGDYVEEGQILAELDDTSIQNQISSQQASMNASSRSSSEQIKAAQSNYDNYKEGLENGLNSSVLSAQSQVETAYEAYENAVLAYDRYKKSIDNGENTTTINARDSLRNAQKSVESAQTAYDEARNSYQSASDAYNNASDALKSDAEAAMNVAKTKMDSTRSALENAIMSYNSAYASYKASITTVDNTLEDYSNKVDSTWDAYQRALTSLESVEKTAQDQLQTYENNLSSAMAASDNSAGSESIRQLTVQLEDTRITAPVSGTVTAVYAEVGSSGSGLMFVIEDTQELIVDTSIQSYDIGKVKVGDKVNITADALSDDIQISGLISKIAPTANKTAKGETDTTTDAVYASEVNVTTADTGLKIGMNVDLDYIIEEQTHILAVPYDAVYKNNSNEKCVIAAIEQDNGKYILKELKVTTGMDDEIDIVISGDEIKEGLRIVNEPDNYISLIGQCIQLSTKTK